MGKAQKVLNYVNSSPVYQKMTDEQRGKIRGLLYDRVGAKLYTSKGLTPPSKEEWVTKNFKPIGGNEAGVFTKATMHYVGETINLAKNITESAEAKFKWVQDKFGQYVIEPINIGTGSIGQPGSAEEWKKNYRKFFEEERNKGKNSKDTIVAGALETSAKPFDDYAEDHPMHGFKEKLIGTTAELAAAAPIYYAVSKGAEAIGAAGVSQFPMLSSLSKTMSATPYGRFVLRALTNGTEGFLFDATTKNNNPLEGAKDFILLGETFHQLPKTLKPVGKLFGKLLPMLGVKGHEEILAATIADMERQGVKRLGPKTIGETKVPVSYNFKDGDKLIFRLKQANALALETISKNKFDKSWYDLNYGQKQSVLKEVAKQTHEASKNPAATSLPAVQLQLTENIAKQAKENPNEFGTVSSALSKLEQKFGTGVADVGRNIHEDAKGVKENVLQKGKKVYGLLDEEMQPKPQVAVGAASRGDIAFDENLMKFLNVDELTGGTHFENRPTHQLVALWGLRRHIGKDFGPKTREIIEKRIMGEFPGTKKADLDSMAKVVINKIKMLDKTGHLDAEGNLFRSTSLIKDAPTIWDQQLKDEFAALKRKGKK